jgi:trans-aconitate methyltransferase
LTEWTTSEHAERYLARQDTIPHRTEGETVLLAHIPRSARRILDLGTGDGRLIALLRLDRPDIEALGLDISRPMLAAARRQLAGEDRITLLHHDMSSRLPDIGRFDDWEDPSNELLDVETQLHWLRELGFEDVDCYWKWLEMALLIGVKPAEQ